MKKIMLITVIFICNCFYPQVNTLINKNDTLFISAVTSQARGTNPADSFNHTILSKPDSVKVASGAFDAIVGELFISPLMGILCSIPATFLSMWIANPGGDMGGLIIIPYVYLGYVTGSALGTYLVGHYYNSNTSFLATLGAGYAGTGLAFAFLYMNKNKSIMTWEAFAFFGLPVLFEILYANLLVSDEYVKIGLKGKTDDLFKTKPVTYKDIYNRTLIFNVEIFRLNF